MNNDGNYFVALDDGDTYSGEGESAVYLLSSAGTDELDKGGMKHVSHQNILKKVLITDLIDCWIERNGKF